MATYNYPQVTAPDIDSIILGIAESAMTNKSCNSCVWDQENEDLAITFDDELSVPDKAILDQVVDNPPTPSPVHIVSPNGTVWNVTVSDVGTLAAEQITY